MRQLGCLFLLLFYAICSFSQERDTTWEKESENIILFSPINLVDPANPAFCVGFGRYFNNRVGAVVDLGVIIPNGLWALMNDDKTRHEGYKVRGEIMVALKDIYPTEVYNENHYKKVKKHFRYFPYLALDFFYIQNIYSTASTFKYSSADSTVYYKDGYTVFKEKKGINLKFGLNFHVRHFVVSAYGGVGIATRHVVHTNRDNLSHQMSLYDPSRNDTGPYYRLFANDAGTRTYINPVLNLKIGYSFGKLPPRKVRKQDE